MKVTTEVKEKSIAIVFCILLVAGLAACGKPASSEPPVGDDRVYRVAIDQSYAPFSIPMEDGTYEGIDIDIMNAIAQIEGFAVEIEPMEFSSIIPSLNSGMIDIAMGCVTITDGRKESVDFTDPYYATGQSLITKKSSDIDALQDLKGKTLAVMEGSVGEEWAVAHQAEYGFTISSLPGFEDTASAVRKGEADALIEDYPVIRYYIEANDKKDLRIAVETIDQIGDVGMCIKKGADPELLRILNVGLARIKENGTYDEILTEYES